MKKVLVIAYYWPPAGGGGVQRWLKFTRYLPEFGWEPIVFAPENADYPLLDETLQAEVPESLQVIRRPILEPRTLYKRLVDRKALDRPGNMDEIFFRPKEERGFLQNASLWLRGNLFIPDARVLWVRPSAKWLRTYLVDNPVEAIVTTGPPHSLHLIGRDLKRKLALPWIADFRDPWTEIEFYDKMMLSYPANRLHHRLERSIFTEADRVIGVSPYWVKRFQNAGARDVVTITNGFDTSDFDTPKSLLAESFLLSHIGTLSLDRNPTVLWEALRDLCASIEGFRDRARVDLIGKTDPGVKESADAYGLEGMVTDVGYITHASAIERMQASQVLLLLLNHSEPNAPGRMTGKIFEYLAAGRPILLLGPPDSDPARLLEETGAGVAVDYDDRASLVKTLTQWFSRYRNGGLYLESSSVDAYTRKNLTRKLASLLDELTNQQTERAQVDHHP